MRNALGIVFYVIAGFFLYAANVLAFVDGQKKVLMLIFLIPAFASMFIGFRLKKPRAWRLDFGIMLLATAGFVAFIILTAVCIWMTPEFRNMVGLNAPAYFGDYGMGAAFIAMQVIIGLLLISEEKKLIRSRVPKAEV